MAEKVLVLCATGKVGMATCRALKEAGFAVFGTTRTAKSGKRLADAGIAPVTANYTVRADLDRAISETGCKKVFVITDYWGAAKNSKKKEVAQGKTMIDACKAAGVEHVVFCSLIDSDPGHKSEKFNLHHFHSKRDLELYLKESGVPHSILRPAVFFENFDDAVNFNPLKKGQLKFLTKVTCAFCSTYDIGRMAAVQFKDKAQWLGKTQEVMAWKGDLETAAQALAKVSGAPVKSGLCMPLFVRWFLGDLDRMCKYFETGALNDDTIDARIAAFKAHVPEALDAEGWFRYRNTYNNGTPIMA